MTLIEKFAQDHPDADVDGIIHAHCPEDYLLAPYRAARECLHRCESCWNREYIEPDEEKQEEKEMSDVEKFVKEHAAPTILDSGDRTEFETGAVRDMREGKGRCDLMPLDVVGRALNDEIITAIHAFIDSGDKRLLYCILSSFNKKLDCDKYTLLLEVSKHFEEGAKKYGENNWQKGIPVRCYIDSAVRHYLKHCRGDADERHDRAFVWNIMCAIWTCIHKPELNDYRKEETPDAE